MLLRPVGDVGGPDDVHMAKWRRSWSICTRSIICPVSSADELEPLDYLLDSIRFRFRLGLSVISNDSIV